MTKQNSIIVEFKVFIANRLKWLKFIVACFGGPNLNNGRSGAADSFWEYQGCPFYFQYGDFVLSWPFIRQSLSTITHF
ncbi:hypothetical protein DDZ16_09610 [Marinilabilia rubra]|uniref:Uncharacterized protein n=1 Tax=Marinilabilia rubra TaxID=2162893 RepID=A0A2U2B9D9_9BACT|nr:hypothetical protein DDZ16_09610 [Marinilabilia rubra]